MSSPGHGSNARSPRSSGAMPSSKLRLSQPDQQPDVGTATKASSTSSSSSSGFTAINPPSSMSNSVHGPTATSPTASNHHRAAAAAAAMTQQHRPSAPAKSRPDPSELGPTSSPVPTLKRSLLLTIVTFFHGSISLLFVMLQYVLNGKIFHKTTQSDVDLLAQARHRIWSLAIQPLGSPNLHHRFLTLQNGFRLHYVTNTASPSVVDPARSSPNPRHLVVFVHGFPDSWHVWNNQLLDPGLSSTATLVALDLPGYGGSDSLPDYGADSVLSTLTLSIAAIRDLYLPKPSSSSSSSTPPPRVIIVSHDWGAVLSWRLAAEVAPLADRHIPLNCPHMPVVFANGADRLLRAKSLFGTFIHSPFRAVTAIGAAISEASPVVDQLLRSWYVAAFQLPRPLAMMINTTGDTFNATPQPASKFFFRRVVATEASPDLTRRRDLYDPECAIPVGSGVGPSMRECLESASLVSHNKIRSDQSYPPSVRIRAPTGGWLDNIGLYRNDLVLTRWHRNPEVESAMGRIVTSPTAPSWVTDRSITNRPLGRIGVPVTVLWGMADLALNHELALDNLDDWVVKPVPSASTPKMMCGSQVVKMPGIGHWIAESDDGKDVVTNTIAWALATFSEPDRTPRLEDWLRDRIRIYDRLIFPLDTTPL